MSSLVGLVREAGCVVSKNKDSGEEVTLCEIELPLKFPSKKMIARK